MLSYSGDTDSCSGLEEAAQDADLFLCEAAFEEGRDDGIKDVHLTGKRAGEAAAAAGARRLLLTHIPVWTSPTTVMAEAKDGSAAVAGDVAVGPSARAADWHGSDARLPASRRSQPGR